MMNEAIKFSVIIPAYNASDTISETLDSVLGQEGDYAWEAIVVDDGSTDNTFQICQEYAAHDSRIKVFSQANGGTGAALNMAARHASGEFLVQLGADDLLDSAYMKNTGAFILEHPEYDIFASNALRLYQDGSTAPCLGGAFFRERRAITFEDLIWSNKIYGTAAMRRMLFEKVGGFRAGHYNEDYDLWLRLLLEGARAIFQPEFLAYYRVTSGQKTEDTIKVRRGDLFTLRSLLKSKRLTRNQRTLIKLSYKQLQLKIAVKKILGIR